jgi:lactate permease
MLWAVYQQHLDPLAGRVPGSVIWSTILAALPVLALFWLLVPRRWPAPWAGAGATVVAWVLAVVFCGMSPLLATMSFVNGAAFGLLPVGWTIFNAMLLYNVTVKTGQFDIIRRSVAGLSGDARIQAILIAFAFGAFLEGAAGGGTPVAICGAVLVGLGFNPFLAAVLCLIANTSPVAYGGLGTPLITLTGVTDLPTETLSVMAGWQLPFLSALVPLYMVKCMCTWRQTLEVWPALVVAGGSFAVFQFVFATSHVLFPGVELYPMTDIGGGIFSLVVVAVFLQFWKPRKDWHFDMPASEPGAAAPGAAASGAAPGVAAPGSPAALNPHAAEAAALLGGQAAPTAKAEGPLTTRKVAVAWAPFVLMSVLLLLTGIVRQKEGKGPVKFWGIQTNYIVPIAWLNGEVFRDSRLLEDPSNAKPEAATFNFAWLTAPGTAVFFSALLSMLFLGMNREEVAWAFKRTVVQMKIPNPTIAFMLGLSYITRYAGMDATLGVAFAGTGVLYPFFAPLLGWLGVFLTGTDAGSNALFGSLQKITATQIHNVGAFQHLSLDQAQVLICTANSTGGVMGKMIDAQSIVVATAATHQLGREADIFKAVVWHSILLASIVGLLTLLQAYVLPFTRMVPHVK